MKKIQDIQSVMNVFLDLHKWNSSTAEKKSKIIKQVGVVEDDQKSPRAMPFVLFNIFSDRFCSAGVSGEFWILKLKHWVLTLFPKFKQSWRSISTWSSTLIRICLRPCTMRKSSWCTFSRLWVQSSQTAFWATSRRSYWCNFCMRRGRQSSP